MSGHTPNRPKKLGDRPNINKPRIEKARLDQVGRDLERLDRARRFRDVFEAANPDAPRFQEGPSSTGGNISGMTTLVAPRNNRKRNRNQPGLLNEPGSFGQGTRGGFGLIRTLGGR